MNLHDNAPSKRHALTNDPGDGTNTVSSGRAEPRQDMGRPIRGGVTSPRWSRSKAAWPSRSFTV